MANLLFSILIFTLFTLLQTISVRIYKFDELIIDIKFFHFHLILYPHRKSKKKKKATFFKRLRKKASNILPTRVMVEKLISKSNIYIKEIVLFAKSEVDTYFVRQYNLYNFVCVAIAYLQAKSRKLFFESNDEVIFSSNTGQGSLNFDMTFYFKLFDLLIAFFSFIAIKVRKSGWKIV